MATLKCFKRFMDNTDVVKRTTLRIEKKPLVLVLPYLGSITLQTRTKLKKSFINIFKLLQIANSV